MQRSTSSSATALVEQRQADLRRQADRWRLAHIVRADRRSARLIRRRWWRPATGQPEPEPSTDCRSSSGRRGGQISREVERDLVLEATWRR